MLLPETDNPAAVKIAERCQQLMMKLQISHQQSEVSQLLTISIGIGTIVPGPHDQLVDFVEQVDQALYRAKESGRNCIKAA